MENHLARRNQMFRKEIRREQIESYQKSRRKELMEWSSNQRGEDEDSEIEAAYLGAIEYTQLQKMVKMDQSTCNNHLQMLNEVVFSMISHKFNKAFEDILSVVIEYFEIAYLKWRDDGLNHLRESNCSVSLDFWEEMVEIFALTKLFSFISSDLLIKFVGGIYYEIAIRNKFLLRKIVCLMIRILAFSFKDAGTIRDSLKAFDGVYDEQVNQKINRAFVLTIFMNVSCTEDDEILEIMDEQSIFTSLAEYLDVYGFSERELEHLSGIYSNSIPYLCKKLKNSPITKEKYITQLQIESISNYFLYLPIFQHLVGLQNELILSRLITVSIFILKASWKQNLEGKQYILNLIETMVRNITTMGLFINQLEEIFIILSDLYQTKQFIGWLTDFLIFILQNYLIVYHGKHFIKTPARERYEERIPPSKIIHNIKELIAASETLLCRCGEGQLENQQLIVKVLIQFWCKEELIMGNIELINFFRAAIEHNEALSTYILFDCFSEQILGFMNGSYEQIEQIRSVLFLIDSAIERIKQLNSKALKNYLLDYRDKWNSIQSQIQGFCNISHSQNRQLTHLSEAVYQKLSDLLLHDYNI